MGDLEDFIRRRMSHATKRILECKAMHGPKPGKSHTYQGGQELGYWQGMATAYDNILSEIESSGIKSSPFPQSKTDGEFVENFGADTNIS